jgi:ABC-type transporter Mla subunit MlaD
MALQDLTPQLRTRLGRVERVVGLFVGVATLLLLAGFSYYVYHTAQRKGWYLTKAPYFTYVTSAAGLKVGSPVKLMGLDVGEITRVTPEAPEKEYNIYVEFIVKEPFFGYIWDNSEVKVLSADFLGGRYLEVTKGTTNANGTKPHPSYQTTGRELSSMYVDTNGQYIPFVRGKTLYYLYADDPPAVTERLEQLVRQGQAALPNILNLTNHLTDVLTNANRLMLDLDTIARDARPAIRDLTNITANLTNPQGSLGDWLIPTNLNRQLLLTLGNTRETLRSFQDTLTNANGTLTNADALIQHTDEGLISLVNSLTVTLQEISGMTSNLNAQVQANTNILTEISSAVVHADELMQGLKKHWLLKSAFKTNAPPAQPSAKPPAPRRKP